MMPFDLMTWTSTIVLVVGSSLVFIWFLRDAGSVLHGWEEEPETNSKGGPSNQVREPDEMEGRDVSS